jgi:hypothetical protein
MRASRLRILSALAVAAAALVVSAPGSSTAATVAHKAPRFQFGINTYVTYGCTPTATYDAWATTEIKQYKALGANTIALAFPLYTDSLTSNDVYAKLDCTTYEYQTPTPAVLAGIVAIAHRNGLAVLLRPLIDEATLAAENHSYWRGQLAPASVSTWFTNYLATLRPYLQMAQSYHVEHFALQTELDSLADLPNWSTAISLSRALYKGDLSFDYSWDTPTVKTWRAGTSPAIDAYPKIVSGSISQTVPQLVAAWNHLLKSRSYYTIPTVSKVTIQEIGIAAQDGAYLQPYLGALVPASKYPFNQLVQVRWFSAACSFMKQHGMKGIYYWGPWVGANAGSMLKAPNPNRPSDIQPEAQAAIKACFK